MIITKTPFRISFFGGGSDYPSWYKENLGEVISASINKFLFIAIKKYQPFFKTKYRLTYSEIENVNSVGKIKHKVVREALKRYCPKNGIEINYFADLPSNSGIGSSSSFTVGLINGLKTFNNNKISKENLAKESIYFEQEILKENVGSQDQIAAAHGGFNEIRFFKNGNYSINPIITDIEKIKSFEKKFILIFTGARKKKQTADTITRKFIHKLNSVKKRNIFEIMSFAKAAKDMIKKNQFDDFGRLLNQSWKVKRDLSNSISNSKIDELYEFGIRNGALGGKLLGAGGAGFFLFYVPNKFQSKFIKSMKKNIVVPFKFEKEGSKIIFNDEKN